MQSGNQAVRFWESRCLLLWFDLVLLACISGLTKFDRIKGHTNSINHGELMWKLMWAHENWSKNRELLEMNFFFTSSYIFRELTNNNFREENIRNS